MKEKTKLEDYRTRNISDADGVLIISARIKSEGYTYSYTTWIINDFHNILTQDKLVAEFVKRNVEQSPNLIYDWHINPDNNYINKLYK